MQQRRGFHFNVALTPIGRHCAVVAMRGFDDGASIIEKCLIAILFSTHELLFCEWRWKALSISIYFKIYWDTSFWYVILITNVINQQHANTLHFNGIRWVPTCLHKKEWIGYNVRRILDMTGLRVIEYPSFKKATSPSTWISTTHFCHMSNVYLHSFGDTYSVHREPDLANAYSVTSCWLL